MGKKRRPVWLLGVVLIIAGIVAVNALALAKVTADFERGRLFAMGIMKMGIVAGAVLMVLDFVRRRKRDDQDKDQ